jgi:glutaredoxin 3
MTSVTVYTAKPCGYCRAALRFLTEVKSVEVEEIDLTRNTEKRMELIQQTGHRTVPMIFIGEQFIGGYSELRELDAQRELNKMLGIEEK